VLTYDARLGEGAGEHGLSVIAPGLSSPKIATASDAAGPKHIPLYKLLLTVAAVAVPNAMIAEFNAEHGVDVGLSFENWFGTPPAAQLVAGFAIAFWATLTWPAPTGR
jgi:hypothetical protein